MFGWRGAVGFSERDGTNSRCMDGTVSLDTLDGTFTCQGGVENCFQ